MIHEFDYEDDVRVIISPPGNNIVGTFQGVSNREGKKTYYVVKDNVSEILYWVEPEYVVPANVLDDNNPNKTFKRRNENGE